MAWPRHVGGAKEHAQRVGGAWGAGLGGGGVSNSKEGGTARGGVGAVFAAEMGVSEWVEPPWAVSRPHPARWRLQEGAKFDREFHAPAAPPPEGSDPKKQVGGIPRPQTPNISRNPAKPCNFVFLGFARGHSLKEVGVELGDFGSFAVASQRLRGLAGVWRMFGFSRRGISSHRSRRRAADGGGVTGRRPWEAVQVTLGVSPSPRNGCGVWREFGVCLGFRGEESPRVAPVDLPPTAAELLGVDRGRRSRVWQRLRVLAGVRHMFGLRGRENSSNHSHRPSPFGGGVTAQ